MENTLKWAIIQTLIPSPAWGGVAYGHPTFEWLDDRDIPTDAECEAELIEIEALKAIEESNAQAKAAYDTAIEAGYDYNGVIYDCDEQFTTDLVKMIMLVTLQPEEPVYLMDTDGGVHTMTCDNFKLFAAALGYHAYTLRQQYWAALQ